MEVSGLEPPTSSLRTKRSSRLSYTPAGHPSYRRATPSRSLLLVRRIPDLFWNLFGYGLWGVGCLLFAVAAVRDGDVLSTVAGLLFLVGVVVVIGPLIRASRKD